MKLISRSILLQATSIAGVLTALSVGLSVAIRWWMDMDMSSDTVMARTLATALVAFPISLFALARIQRLENAYLAMLKEARKLAAEANSDPLTGLLNRRSFERQLDHGLSCRASGQFLIADIDYLKRINDTHGHLAGDDAILSAAAALVEVLGPGAIISRIGGDEFCAWLPDGGLAPADALTADLSDRATRHFKRRSGIADVPLTLSLALGPCRAGMRFRDLIAGTDASLYRKKRSRTPPAMAEGDSR